MVPGGVLFPMRTLPPMKEEVDIDSSGVDRPLIGVFRAPTGLADVEEGLEDVILLTWYGVLEEESDVSVDLHGRMVFAVYIVPSATIAGPEVLEPLELEVGGGGIDLLGLDELFLVPPAGRDEVRFKGVSWVRVV